MTSKPSSNSKKILVADDNPQILEMLDEFLSAHGFAVSVAQDGQKALQQAKKKPQLILLDVNMPKVDGFEVLRRLKADKKTAGIPVIMLTFRQEMSDIVKGLANLADKYIPKPFDMEVLIKEIRETLARHQKRRL